MLLAELCEVVDRPSRQRDFGPVAEFVGEVGVERLPAALRGERDERAEASAHVLDHREGGVGPPLVGLQVLDQRQFRGDGGDAGVVLEDRSDGADLPLQPVERGFGAQHRELEVQHDEVELLRLECVAVGLGGQRRDGVDQVADGGLVELAGLPCVGIVEPFDETSVGAHDEVVEVHRRHVESEHLGELGSLDSVSVELVEGADELDAAGEQSGRQRYARAAFVAGGVLAEVLEVLAEVEDVEAVLILPGPDR